MDNISKRKPKSSINFKITLDDEQKQAKELILKKPISFIFGRAGSGKTLLAVQCALDLYFNREIEKIVITRPTVSSEDNGFIPGNIQEKLDPWMVPVKDNMYKVYDRDKIVQMELDKKIELIALTHFRGRTFENAFCIVDEFQNLTEKQLEMCLGRLGKNSRIVFSGDLDQIDLLPRFEKIIGAVEALKKSKYTNHIQLTGNHRHEALIEIFEILTKFKEHGINK